MEPLRILVVEDEMLIARKLEMILTRAGYAVTGLAGTYSDALASFEKDPPDVVLLDIFLGGAKSGIDVGVWIQENQPVPVIFLTSFSDRETITQAKTASPSAYLTKPFKSEDLTAAIEIAISNFSRGQVPEKSDSASPVPDQNLILKDSIFIHDHHVYKKLAVDDILWLKGEGSYTSIHLADEKHMVRAYLKDFEPLEASHDFMRVHKSYIINMHKIDSISANCILIGEEEVPVSRTVREAILQRLRIF